MVPMESSALNKQVSLSELLGFLWERRVAFLTITTAVFVLVGGALYYSKVPKFVVSFTIQPIGVNAEGLRNQVTARVNGGPNFKDASVKDFKIERPSNSIRVQLHVANKVSKADLDSLLGVEMVPSGPEESSTSTAGEPVPAVPPFTAVNLEDLNATQAALHKLKLKGQQLTKKVEALKVFSAHSEDHTGDLGSVGATLPLDEDYLGEVLILPLKAQVTIFSLARDETVKRIEDMTERVNLLQAWMDNVLTPEQAKELATMLPQVPVPTRRIFDWSVARPSAGTSIKILAFSFTLAVLVAMAFIVLAYMTRRLRHQKA